MNQAKLTPQQITKLLERFTQKELADIFGVSAKTIRNWRKENNQPKQKVGRKSKIDKRALEFLLNYVQSHNTKTQQETTDYLSQQIGRRISRQTVGWWLKKSNYSYKRLTYKYSEQPTKEEIRSFINKIKNCPRINF